MYIFGIWGVFFSEVGRSTRVYVYLSAVHFFRKFPWGAGGIIIIITVVSVSVGMYCLSCPCQQKCSAPQALARLVYLYCAGGCSRRSLFPDLTDVRRSHACFSSRAVRSISLLCVLSRFQVAVLTARLEGKDMELESIKEDNSEMQQKVGRAGRASVKKKKLLPSRTRGGSAVIVVAMLMFTVEESGPFEEPVPDLVDINLPVRASIIRSTDLSVSCMMALVSLVLAFAVCVLQNVCCLDYSIISRGAYACLLLSPLVVFVSFRVYVIETTFVGVSQLHYIFTLFLCCLSSCLPIPTIFNLGQFCTPTLWSRWRSID